MFGEITFALMLSALIVAAVAVVLDRIERQRVAKMREAVDRTLAESAARLADLERRRKMRGY